MLRDSVRLALRWSHNLLDGEIDDAIQEARAEMIRAGVPAEVAGRDTALTKRAIKTYCKANFAQETKARESFLASFDSQVENLRKSSVKERCGYV